MTVTASLPQGKIPGKVLWDGKYELSIIGKSVEVEVRVSNLITAILYTLLLMVPVCGMGLALILFTDVLFARAVGGLVIAGILVPGFFFIATKTLERQKFSIDKSTVASVSNERNGLIKVTFDDGSFLAFRPDNRQQFVHLLNQVGITIE